MHSFRFKLLGGLQFSIIWSREMFSFNVSSYMAYCSTIDWHFSAMDIFFVVNIFGIWYVSGPIRNLLPQKRLKFSKTTRNCLNETALFKMSPWLPTWKRIFRKCQKFCITDGRHALLLSRSATSWFLPVLAYGTLNSFKFLSFYKGNVLDSKYSTK